MSDESNLSDLSQDDADDVSQISPPTYSVFEDSHGSLMNLELEVKWPNRPQTGRHSIEEYLKRKSEKRHKHSRKPKGAFPAMNSSPELVPPESEHFIGVHSSSRVSKFLQPTKFVLYYLRPDAICSLDEIPACLPLILAYMSAKGVIYHFDIEVTEDDQGQLWNVVVDNDNQQPYFRTMKALINYYDNYGTLRKDGSIEMFTLPES